MHQGRIASVEQDSHRFGFAGSVCVPYLFARNTGMDVAAASIEIASLGRLCHACLWRNQPKPYGIDSHRKRDSISQQPFARIALAGRFPVLFEGYIALTFFAFFCGCRVASTLWFIRGVLINSNISRQCANSSRVYVASIRPSGKRCHLLRMAGKLTPAFHRIVIVLKSPDMDLIWGFSSFRSSPIRRREGVKVGIVLSVSDSRGMGDIGDIGDKFIFSSYKQCFSVTHIT